MSSPTWALVGVGLRLTVGSITEHRYGSQRMSRIKMSANPNVNPSYRYSAQLGSVFDEISGALGIRLQSELSVYGTVLPTTGNELPNSREAFSF